MLIIHTNINLGTHDMELARRFFGALCAGEPTRVPQYDKSAHGGEGDRVPEAEWETVNDVAGAGQRRVQVVIFEGWCVGFRRLGATAVEERWRQAAAAEEEGQRQRQRETGMGTGGGRTRTTLPRHALEHLQLVDERLGAYDGAVTDLLDAFIHVDAEDTAWVYDWRLEQEVRLRRERGAGMTDEQVFRFVDAYYPAYELFSDGVRKGIFPDRPGCQLRLVVGKDRSVKDKIIL